MIGRKNTTRHVLVSWKFGILFFIHRGIIDIMSKFVLWNTSYTIVINVIKICKYTTQSNRREKKNTIIIFFPLLVYSDHLLTMSFYRFRRIWTGIEYHWHCSLRNQTHKTRSKLKRPTAAARRRLWWRRIYINWSSAGTRRQSRDKHAFLVCSMTRLLETGVDKKNDDDNVY